MPSFLDQGDQDDLRPAEEPDRRRDRADASGDKNPAAWSLDQAREVFLTVTRRHNRGTTAGHDNLSPVGVAGENESDATVADGLDEVWIVRQEQHGVIVAGVPQGRIEVLIIGP